LLDNPKRLGISRHIEMQDLTPVVADDEKAVPIQNAPILGERLTETRPVQPPEIGPVVADRQAGGLQHRYERRAA
jgi:hypothetical protein